MLVDKTNWGSSDGECPGVQLVPKDGWTCEVAGCGKQGYLKCDSKVNFLCFKNCFIHKGCQRIMCDHHMEVLFRNFDSANPCSGNKEVDVVTCRVREGDDKADKDKDSECKETYELAKCIN